MDEIKKRFQQLSDRGVSVKAAIAEMLGTAGLVLIGLLTVVHAEDPALGLSDTLVVNFVIAFAFGIGIAVMIYMTTFTSGGHLNPAISCAMLAAGVLPPVQAIAHMISQFIGGIIATLLLLILVPHSVLKGTCLGANRVPDGSNFVHAFLGEVVGMFIIQLTILEVATHKNSSAGSNVPLAIGLVFAVCILAFSPVSSASFNPARSLGPALLSGHLGHLWIFIAGPIAGALLSVPVHLASLADFDTKWPAPTDAEPPVAGVSEVSSEVMRVEQDAAAPLLPQSNTV